LMRWKACSRAPFIMSKSSRAVRTSALLPH
jgi:hypothetical protein